MKKNIKKSIALLMALMLISGVLLACGDTGNKPADNPGETISLSPEAGGTNEGESGEPDEAEARILPDLPDDIQFDGYTLKVLGHREESDDWLESDPREIVSEEENGEPINDAIYKRNSILKDRYNIEFEITTHTDERSVLNKTVKAGDDAYDAVLIFNNNVPGVITGDLLTEVSNLPYVDLNKPWWDPAVNSMSVLNKNYLLAGDMLILDNEATNALLFNKDLMADLGMELPYKLVQEGKWTMDRLEEMVKGASADLNGDTQMVPLDDRWGFVTFNDTLHALLVSGGGALAAKNSDDVPYISFAEAKNIGVIEKAMDIVYNKQDVLNIQADVAPPGTANENWFKAYHGAFEENRALFMWVRMRVVEKFRGMTSNFGILPLPKFNESQENYYSLVNPYTGVLLGVPKSVIDLERTSIILEAMAAESRYTIQPAYYDVVLQRKFTRDDESSEMLDIIFNSRVYDIGGVYSFGNVFMDFIALCNKSDRNIISYYEKKGASMEKAIEKLITTIEEMD